MFKSLIKSLYEQMYSKEIELEKSNYESQIASLTAELRNFKSNEPSLTFPTILGSLKLTEIYAVLNNFCKEVYISDEYLNTTSVDEASKFSNATHVQYAQWVNNNHDCDNFSFALMGYWSEGLKSYAFGVAWTAVHAFNIMIDNNKQVWIVEPQTNKYTKIEEVTDPKYLNLRFILM